MTARSGQPSALSYRGGEGGEWSRDGGAAGPQRLRAPAMGMFEPPGGPVKVNGRPAEATTPAPHTAHFPNF